MKSGEWLSEYLNTGLSLGIGFGFGYAVFRHGWLGYLLALAALFGLYVLSLAAYGFITKLAEDRGKGEFVWRDE